MPIGNLANKVSKSDAARMNDIRNPPEFEPGFEDSIDSSGFDDLFDDLGSSDFGSDSGQSSQGGFGGSGGDSGFNSSGGSFGGQSSFGNAGFGQQNSFGNSSFGSNGFSGQSGFGNAGFGGQSGFGSNGFGTSGFGNQPFGAQQVQQQPKPNLGDKIADTSAVAAESLGKITVELFKSIRHRTADDFGYLSRNLILSGLGCFIAGIIFGLISTVSGSSGMSFAGIPAQFIGAGLLTAGTGLTGIGFSAIKIAQSDQDVSSTNIQELEDVAESEPDDATEDYEMNIGNIMDDLFGDSDELESDDSSIWDDEPEESEEEPEPVFAAPVKVNFEEQLNTVSENQYLSRETLFNTFKGFFPCNTPTFADKREVDPSEELFNNLATLSLKALSNVAKCELEDLKSELDSAVETYFSFELKLKRIRGIKNTEDIAREMESYFRDGSSDTSVNATVDIEGDFYKVILTKGVSAVVTFGDIFRQQYACDFFLNSDNKLPIITGISELGEVILNDAKVYDTMLIAGKPRSGKSWYVFSVLMALAMFNTPEDVQFIVVDPKESNLFNTFALMPHVAGLHNDEKILDIMDDIISKEGPRRKRLLADNRCDDIWALRKKGVKIPILYLVIDEYITVRNNLGQLDKELDTKLQVIISQLPSLGIRLLFVPHRATGVVNKTNRTMLQFTASVKGDIEDVKDTLGITKWTRALTKPGDIAIKTSTIQDAMYVRGGALTTSDEENAELMRNVAKAFYKMGVDIPDTSSMRIACNRDEDAIREELQENGRRIQWSIDKTDDVDLSNSLNFLDDLDDI